MNTEAQAYIISTMLIPSLCLGHLSREAAQHHLKGRTQQSKLPVLQPGPCHGLEGTNQSRTSPLPAQAAKGSPWRQSHAGEALQTPQQEGTTPEEPDALWAPSPQEINEACPAKPS